MKKLIVAAAVGLCLAGAAHAGTGPAQADPHDGSNAASGFRENGFAYFDTTVVVAAGGDSVAFGFWAERFKVRQFGVTAATDSGWVTIFPATTNAAGDTLLGGSRRGLQRIASGGVRMWMLLKGEFMPGASIVSSETFDGKWLGVVLIPSKASNKVTVQAWRKLP